SFPAGYQGESVSGGSPGRWGHAARNGDSPASARHQFSACLPGLEKNQYSILWVEHQDKGRLELNFVIPNMELQTGKRLQPY
ncbi:hypothetical protein ACSLPB_29600, partial [Escherichia coli]|uniref:hypothetical protein n=1 Tax=Escherichia coli TaxID=562 RepID=UPI003EE2C570